MKPNKKRVRLNPVTVLLVIGASLGLMSAAITAGIVPGFKVGGVHSQSPTATYQGYFSVGYTGVYHFVHAEPLCHTSFPPCLASDETLFYLTTPNAAIRLIFYCGKVPDFCVDPSQLPFNDGACLYVNGTLLEPSKWPSTDFSPKMEFPRELYVFHYEALPSNFCSELT